ncbi:hypothetical protein FA95DRAFT_366760 [Auriscalpium vulgare]|uniref:Uncharacterized protein n=1 Tax=Auriscalpium vulgare TaxID=40419 RepID=A0ACB8RIW7_9AGAM|nr:hypothetical protein FA95DRAFT_366760 [Auriscalpium vulgare]
MASVANQLGAYLAGTLICMAFSGFLALQVFLYFSRHSKDPASHKIVVACLWFVDALQSIMAAISAWQFFIVHFNQPEIGRHLFVTTILAKYCTGFMNLIANLFYLHRIHRLTRGNWLITGPILFLSIARFGTATTTTVILFDLKSTSTYAHKYKPLWTTGLAIAALTDVLITTVLCCHIRSGGHVRSSTAKMLNALVVLTINNGVLTRRVAMKLEYSADASERSHMFENSSVSIACLICWLTMSQNLVFFALYLLIGKIYAISLISSLNMRSWIRQRSERGPVRNIVLTALGGHAVEQSYDVERDGSTSFSRTPPPHTRSDIEVREIPLMAFMNLFIHHHIRLWKFV